MRSAGEQQPAHETGEPLGPESCMRLPTSGDSSCKKRPQVLTPCVAVGDDSKIRSIRIIEVEQECPEKVITKLAAIEGAGGQFKLPTRFGWNSVKMSPFNLCRLPAAVFSN